MIATGGYNVVDLSFSSTYNTPHQLFIREHSIRNESADKPAGRTLFVANIPPFATEDSVKRAFSVAGTVKSVTFQNKIKDEDTKSSAFKYAYIVFKKTCGVENALNLKAVGPLSTEEHPVLTGLRKWMKEYNDKVKSVPKVKEHSKQVIQKYDKEEERKSKGSATTDEEGWTVVSRKGRRPGLGQNEAQKRGKSGKELKNFYTFQIKEEKMKEIVALRKKHEEDKRKVDALKKSRKFKPY